MSEQPRDGKGRFIKKSANAAPVHRKTIEVKLPGVDCSAQIVITRVGQQPPYVGDRVVARAEIRLPARSGCLAPEIRFDRRVRILDRPLFFNWGKNAEDGSYRYVEVTAAADTWRRAFEKLDYLALTELSKLIEALRRRQRTLECAEESRAV